MRWGLGFGVVLFAVVAVSTPDHFTVVMATLAATSFLIAFVLEVTGR